MLSMMKFRHVIFKFRNFSTNSTVKGSSGVVRPLTVRTCVGLYPKLRAIWPHLYPKHAPEEGLDLTVNYADTANDADASLAHKRTIVGVHGCPGYLTHFDRLIEHYHGTDTRIIVPNLPDFAHTRSSGLMYFHSTAEKVAFLKDFLKKLKIDQIDCLVGHSFGIQTVAALWEKPDGINIKSVALFSPQPLWDKTPTQLRIMKFWFKYKSEPWFRLLSLSRVHLLPIWRMKFTDINEFLMINSIALDHLSPIELNRRIDSLVNSSNIPLTLMYGSAEPLVGRESIKDLHAKFGISPQEIINLDPNDAKSYDLIRQQHNKRQKFNSYLLKDGGHFAFAKHSRHSVMMIDNLLGL